MVNYNKARIDVKNHGGRDNVVEVVEISAESNVQAPAWMEGADGKGVVIHNSTGALSAKFKCQGKGRLRFSLRGVDERICDDVRRPLYVCYKKFVLNGKLTVFDHDVYACHDLPYTYFLNVQDQETVEVQIEWNTIKKLTDICSLPVAFGDGGALEYLVNKERILESRIAALELELSMLTRSTAVPAKSQVDQIISEYRSNVWGLKSHIGEISDAKQRVVFIQAYDKILRDYGSWIAWNSRFDGRPCLPHGFYGIFISGGARIGKNAVIFQHVTIGSNTIEGSKRSGSPIIGDNCYIGAGAKIIGKVKIGNNCRIGANAVVTIDVPDDSVVVMGKPRIIHKEGMDNKFYNIINGVKVYHLGDKHFPVNASASPSNLC